MHYPMPLPEPLNKGTFTVHEALHRGVSRPQLRSRNLRVNSRGIRIWRDFDGDPDARIRPYTHVTQRSAASHESAQKLWKLPSTRAREVEKMIHITRPAGSAAPRRKGVIGHQSKLYPGEVVWHKGVLVTSRERTWLDLAETFPVDQLVIIADHLLRIPRFELEGRSHPYTTKEQLQQLLDRHRGKQGIRRARQALELSRVGADSAQETLLRLAMIRAGLPEPLLNQALIGADGVEYHEPDLSYPQYRVAIEYEGGGHSDPDQIVRDIDREDRVSTAGWMQVRISKRHMRNEAAPAVAKIRAALAAQGWTVKQPQKPVSSR